MKILCLSSFLLLSCQKELPKQDPPTIMSIENMCFDGNNYQVSYSVQGLKPGDIVYGGCSKGIDTLGKKNLSSKEGIDSFKVNTGPAGCVVKIFVGVVHIDGTKDYVTAQGNCIDCD